MEADIKFGPAGLGSVEDAVFNLEKYFRLGLRACEIAFTYGAYIKKREDALRIGEKAKKLGIKLSIHAPYWINLNSAEREKIEKSKQRILKCCEVGTWLGAENIVFHPGYYGKTGKEETYNNIKKEILEIQEEIRKNKYTVKLSPETTGKVNVFGGIDEIYRLVQDTKCGFCIDFAHILARYKEYKLDEVLRKFKRYKHLHIHFSGIAYGEKGERHHKKTPEAELRKLLSELLSLGKNKDITVINESPSPVEDSVLALKVFNEFKTN